MDTITMGATIACAMELVERGYLSKEQVGRSLKWGDAEALVELTRMTATREGFGDQLAEGSYRPAYRCGHPELAPVSEKQEFPGYEPRGSQAMGLALCHLAHWRLPYARRSSLFRTVQCS